MQQTTRQLAADLAQLGGGAHALAWQLLGHREDAADAVQDAMLAALQSKSPYDASRGPLKPWFLRVVRNRCLDLLRRRKATEQLSDIETESLTAPSAYNPQSRTECAEQDLELRRALAQLTAAQREVVMLRDHLDLTYAEIARTLEIPQGTVMSRLHRAREALRVQLQETASYE